MKNNFRSSFPVQTCNDTYTDYRRFKSSLAKDFNYRCGYTDCPDEWFGGKNNFHIDHFLPWKKHPEKPSLKTDYSNLVYACSYVNILKSDDEGNYLDPWTVDYNDHFERDENGAIHPIATSPQAIYMYKRLKLFLKRYQIIWTLDQLELKIRSLIEVVSKGNISRNLESRIKDQVFELNKEYFKYKDYLRGNL